MFSMTSIKPQVYFNFNRQLLPAITRADENQYMNHLGLKIKAAIDAKGITQMALAEAVGVSNNAVTKWVKTGKVAKKNIQKVARELDMSVNDFLGVEQSSDVENALKILGNPRLKALFFAAESLPDYKIDALVQTSIALAEQPKQNNNPQ